MLGKVMTFFFTRIESRCENGYLNNTLPNKFMTFRYSSKDRKMVNRLIENDFTQHCSEVDSRRRRWNKYVLDETATFLFSHIFTEKLTRKVARLKSA